MSALFFVYKIKRKEKTMNEQTDEWNSQLHDFIRHIANIMIFTLCLPALTI